MNASRAESVVSSETERRGWFVAMMIIAASGVAFFVHSRATYIDWEEGLPSGLNAPVISFVVALLLPATIIWFSTSTYGAMGALLSMIVTVPVSMLLFAIYLDTLFLGDLDEHPGGVHPIGFGMFAGTAYCLSHVVAAACVLEDPARRSSESAIDP